MTNTTTPATGPFGPARAPGTVDFHYDFHDDLVFARARWSLSTPVEVTRWYEMHARYFASRFSRPKDMITVADAMEVSRSVLPLWERYTVRLHETAVRFSATVVSMPLPASGAGKSPRLPSVDVGSIADAVAAILARRRALAEPPSPDTLRSRR